MTENIVFDIEIFYEDWLIGAKILNTGEYIQIWNDLRAAKDFYAKYKDALHIGFNNMAYDDLVIDYILKGNTDIFRYSKSIINSKSDDRVKWFYSKRYFNFDVSKEFGSGIGGLKVLESDLGLKIQETSVSFNIQRKLTDQERDEIAWYNRHDLDTTELCFQIAMSYSLKTKLTMCELFHLPIKDIRHTLTRMAADGLGAIAGTFPAKHWSDLPVQNLVVSDDLRKHFESEIYFTDAKAKKVFMIDNTEFSLLSGGIHAALPNYHTDWALLIDVKGYYSLIQMHYDLLSRALPPESKEKFKWLYYERLRLKKSNPYLSKAMKTTILSTWGAAGNQYSALYDPSVAALIMQVGQAYICDLCEKLQPYAIIIQANTDGIMVRPKDGLYSTEPNASDIFKINDVVNEWVTRTKFEVENERIYNLYQKDVNNYICKTEKGHVKTKGGFLAGWNFDIDDEYYQWFGYRAKQGQIINKAVCLFLANGTPIEETVNKETNLSMFQYTIKRKSATYLPQLVLATTENGTTSYEVTQAVCRIFASNDTKCKRQLFKQKPNEKIEHMNSVDILTYEPDKVSLLKFANTPSNCFIFNESLKEFTDIDWAKIDRNYYIREAKKRVNAFIYGYDIAEELECTVYSEDELTLLQDLLAGKQDMPAEQTFSIGNALFEVKQDMATITVKGDTIVADVINNKLQNVDAEVTIAVAKRRIKSKDYIHIEGKYWLTAVVRDILPTILTVYEKSKPIEEMHIASLDLLDENINAILLKYSK